MSPFRTIRAGAAALAVGLVARTCRPRVRDLRTGDVGCRGPLDAGPGRARDHRQARPGAVRGPGERAAGAGGRHLCRPGAAPQHRARPRAGRRGWPPRWRRSSAIRRSSTPSPTARFRRQHAERSVLRPAVGALEHRASRSWARAGTPGDDIGATYAWPHATGASVTVAVVDTGVDCTATDLAGTARPGSGLRQHANNDTQDQNGHGTHVAGIIAADQNNGIGVSGVAPGGRGDAASRARRERVRHPTPWRQAFNYAGQHGIRIVNASLGGGGTSQALADAVDAEPEHAVRGRGGQRRHRTTTTRARRSIRATSRRPT